MVHNRISLVPKRQRPLTIQLSLQILKADSLIISELHVLRHEVSPSTRALLRAPMKVEDRRLAPDAFASSPRHIVASTISRELQIYPGMGASNSGIGVGRMSAEAEHKWRDESGGVGDGRRQADARVLLRPDSELRGERVIHARSLRSYLGMTLNQHFLRTMAVASLA